MPTDPTPDPRAARARQLVADKVEGRRLEISRWESALERVTNPSTSITIHGQINAERADLAAWEYVAEVLERHEAERAERAGARQRRSGHIRLGVRGVRGHSGARGGTGEGDGMTGRTLVMGDIHGAHRALVQVLDRCGFDRCRDRLIFLGDVADGWPDTPKCIDTLLSIPNRVCLIGNHDDWLLEWIEGGYPEPMWLAQGGQATLDSYGGRRENVPDSHRAYLKRARLWLEAGDRLFVHGGWPWYTYPHPMGDPENATWDRELWANAVHNHRLGASEHDSLTKFREVYIGHTSTTREGWTEPARCCEVWNMDTGAGWEGRLSVMDIDTKEFWQSDVVADLYPEVRNERLERLRARLAADPEPTP